MKNRAGLTRMAHEQDRRISDVVAGQGTRLRNFIRRRVGDSSDAEDILQDVFAELVEANRLLMPIEHVTGWLFRVAQNRITDLFRKKTPEPFGEAAIEDLLPAPDDGPDAVYERGVLLDALEDALGELPPEQREAFVAHELDGESYKDMAARTGVGINTLLSRKRYAVLHLRERLRGAYEEFKRLRS